MLKKLNYLRYIFLFLALIFLPQLTHAEKAEPAFNSIRAKSDSDNIQFIDKNAPVHTVSLPAIEVNILPSNKGPHQTGITYQLPEPVTNSQLDWKEVAGGYVTHIELFADQAKHLRFHLRFVDHLSIDIQLRVQGNLDIAPFGPIDQSGIYSSELWLPITKGHSAALEIFIKSSSYPDSSIFVLDAINYIVVDSTNSSVIPYSLGLALEKQYDLACWSGNSEYNALKQAAAATAKIHYIASDGASGTCSGTLLTDTGSSFTLWFATANHCIPDQATANSIEFEWFFQATSCNSPRTDSRHEKTSGGAQLLWTDFENDVSFLKLYKKPRGPVWFAGWDMNIKEGDLVWGVHHPQGDHAMASNGNVIDLLQYLPSTHLVDEVRFVNGSAESGSSGSGLFSIDGKNSYWKGTLYGGPLDDNQINYYSHFNRYFDKISGWLRNTAPIPPSTRQISCVFDQYWKNYGYVHAYNSNHQEYIYRFNRAYDFYLGVSYVNNHLYYMYGYNGRIIDLGPFIDWSKRYDCGGDPNTSTWKVKDHRNDDYRVDYKFYDIDNDLVWPSTHQVYYTESYGKEHTHVLTCEPGAKICIGGHSGSSYYSGVYWGVDIDNSNGCTDCCSFCDGSTRYFSFGD